MSPPYLTAAANEHYHVNVLRVDIEPAADAFGLLGSDKRRTGAEK